MLASGAIDAIWIASPNHTRLDVMREIHAAQGARAGPRSSPSPARSRWRGRSPRRARCCGWRRMRACCTAISRTSSSRRPCSAAATSSGGVPCRTPAGPTSPARPRSIPARTSRGSGTAQRQGGGVLSDMMCHSVEVARFLLTAPGEPRDRLKLVSANGTVSTLKWRRPHYADLLREPHRRRDRLRDAGRPRTSPAASSRCEDPDGNEAVIEATTSWAYVGPGPPDHARAARSRIRDGVQLAVDGPEGLPVARGHRQRRRGSGREAERRAGADAGARGRARHLRLHAREPALRRALPRPARCPTRPSPTAWRSSRC